MRWDRFAALWLAEVGTTPPKDAMPLWRQWVEAQTSDPVMVRAVESMAKRYLAAKERDGFTPAPTLRQLKGAFFNAATGAEKAAEAERPVCEFCRSRSRVVFVLDTMEHGADWPPDPATYTGRRAIAAVPCPVCRAADYGAREALRQRVRKFCVRDDRRDTLYRRPEAAGVM